MFRPYPKKTKSKNKKTNRITSSSFYKLTAWKWFSRYQLLRRSKDGVCKCVTCGTIKAINSPKMHVGHLIKVFESGGNTNFSVAFHELNIFPQCFQCNVICGGEQLKMLNYLVDKHGQEEYDNLRMLSKKFKKLDKATLKEISDEYRKKFNELSKIKGNPWKK